MYLSGDEYADDDATSGVDYPDDDESGEDFDDLADYYYGK